MFYSSGPALWEPCELLHEPPVREPQPRFPTDRVLVLKDLRSLLLGCWQPAERQD
jgi:hypothetical protein